VQPFGPGFRFDARQTEIRASSDAPDRLHIRVVDHLENDGDRTLRSLEVRLPDWPNFGTQNLRVTIAGQEVSPQHTSFTDLRMMSAAFNPSWEQQQTREVATEWDLVSGPSSRGTVAASSEGFYIADETALPLWQAPAGIFAKGGPNPAEEILTVFAPPDFRVLAPGTPVNRGTDANTEAQQFRIRPHKDFLPYVVAGRYRQQIVRSPKGTVTFLTFRPLDVQAAQTAGARLSSSMQAFADFFEPLSEGKTSDKKTVVRIAEAPGDLPAEFGATNDSGGTSFPEGVLLDSRAVGRGVANESVLQLAEYELARTWFGWRVRPIPEAQILMGRGVGLFGLVIASEARGTAQRRRLIVSLLDRYDEARGVAADKRLMDFPSAYSRAERVSTGYKAALFFVALEDLCGHDNLRAAFREVVHARSGDEIGYEELRAELETAAQIDLAEMFRTWMIRPGIPDSF